jgi:hypothetical protein
MFSSHPIKNIAQIIRQRRIAALPIQKLENGSAKLCPGSGGIVLLQAK